MSNDANWELYRSFLGVIEHASLSGAARALGIAQPTVGRHIAALEKSLGLPLFTRSQTGLLPTESALELRSYAEAMRTNVAAMRRAAASHGKEVKGTVRISASEVMGIEVLPRIVARLQAAHPRLKVELVLSNRLQDVLRREVDIAVRNTEPKQGQLIARRIGQVELGLHAHERYLSRRGTPAKPAELLAAHALVGFDEETVYLRNAKKQVPGWEREAFSLRADSDIAQLALIRAGAGIGVCQVPLALRDPALIRVLPAITLPLPVWLVMHEDLRATRACRAAFDALLQGLLDYVGS